MKPSTTVSKLSQYVSYLIAVILILLPFHAFITVWPASLVGHYTVLRLWKEFLLILLLLASLYMLATERVLRQRFLAFWAARLIGLYAIVQLVWAFVALAHRDVTQKAMWYGLLVNLRFLIFFLVVWLVAQKSNWLAERWPKILLMPAVLVGAFAILQYLVLPYDFLKHFGYGDTTIPPYETINHNLNHIRVISTLRGANPLGAYLILPISAITALLIREKRDQNDKLIMGAGLLLALVFSFSRSAWLGAVLSIAIVIWASLKNARLKDSLAWGVAGLVILAAGLLAVFHNNTTVQDVLFHTDRASTIATSSNEGHRAAFKSGVRDLVHQPLGSGVGTAGPESVYNYGHPVRIAENYFLQIGQETGLIGLALFVAICVIVGKVLWQKRADTLGLWLFASFIGVTFVNLLSHAWADDTLAYLWWGLAGIACSSVILTDRRKQNGKIKTTSQTGRSIH